MHWLRAHVLYVYKSVLSSPDLSIRIWDIFHIFLWHCSKRGLLGHIYSLRCVWIFQASFQDPFLGHIHPVTTGIVNATLYSALRLRSPDMDTLVTLLATKHPWQLNKLIRWHQIYSTFLLILVMKTVRWYSYWSKICCRLVVNNKKRQCFNFQLACESSV